MLLLNREEIEKVFTIEDAIAADKEAFLSDTKKKIETPLRTVIPGKNNGTYLFMPAYGEDLGAAALKVINIFPENPARGLMTSPAQVMLMDGETGYVVAILDGTYVTQLRTGASSGAAFDVLAKKNCRKGALIGTGGQAETQLLAMAAARDLEEVAIYSVDEGRCRQFVERMTKVLAGRTGGKGAAPKLTAAKSSNECIEEADLIITVTVSTTPVFDGTKVKEGATISCVGTFQPDKHEMDPAILPRAAKIYCDSKEAALSETGDLLLPIADGLITEEDILGDLGQVLAGDLPGRESDEEIIVYETVGIAAMDLVTAKHIYDKAVAAGAGMSWE